MCGIVGIVGRDATMTVDYPLFEKMTASLEHRGPDDGGVYINRSIAFGHRRLAVIDLSGGRQPVINDESTQVLVYNGEIYNFRELRRTLETEKGVSFKTDCDTEVLLHMASISDFEWLESLNGMFAFALWDHN